jgi:hypothetical protein
MLKGWSWWRVVVKLLRACKGVQRSCVSKFFELSHAQGPTGPGDWFGNSWRQHRQQGCSCCYCVFRFFFWAIAAGPIKKLAEKSPSLRK